MRRNYAYADVSGDSYRTREIPLAAFAQDPPSYRNACIGVTFSNGVSGAANVAQHLALGAPLLFEIQPRWVDRWAVPGRGAPQFQERIQPAELANAFAAHAAHWRPRDIFEAKTGVLRRAPAQLDFVDLGLLPALEGMVQQKLDQLLQQTLAEVVAAHRQASGQELDDRELYRLLFRFIAAKVLRDRDQPGGWHSDDASVVLAAVQDYYGSDSHLLSPVGMDDRATLAAAWSAISAKFYFQNLSVDDLAFVYENTFVTRETRRAFGTHSTPPHIAEYVLQKLPLERLDKSRRRILEPCSGHGIFLVSAMRRLRELLSAGLSHQERHGYLRERLVGIDVDPFALEVCRLNLMLADYPNPNGWKLHQQDVFGTDLLASELAHADVVLCNPPYGLFDPDERGRYGRRLRHPQKPAQLLSLILDRPPELLGLVFPKAFIVGRSYREAQRRLARHYGEIELVTLPDAVFNHSDEETVLILASERRPHGPRVQVTCRVVTAAQYPEFRDRLAEPPAASLELPTELAQSRNFTLWIPQPHSVWQSLRHHPTLGERVIVRCGIEWHRGVRSEDVVSGEPRPGWQPAYTTARGNLSQYRLKKARYLNPDPLNIRRCPPTLDWALPKVLVNAIASSRGPWRLSAAIDRSGALATETFHTVFPRQDTSVELIAALLNGPVVNAWLYAQEGKRHNHTSILKACPFPREEALDAVAIIQRVSELETILRETASIPEPDVHRSTRLVAEIDALVLHAYGLTPEQEAELLAVFSGYRRPFSLGEVSYAEQFDAVREAVRREQAQRQRVRRYQALVDQEFLGRLNSDEAAEMEQLGAEIDRYYDPFYEPMLQRLEAELAQRRGG